MQEKRGWRKPKLLKLKKVNGKVEINGRFYTKEEILGIEKKKHKKSAKKHLVHH